MTTKLQTIIHILQTVPVFAQSRVADLELLARSINHASAEKRRVSERLSPRVRKPSSVAV